MFFGFQTKDLILRFQIDCYTKVHFLTGVVQKIFTVCLLSAGKLYSAQKSENGLQEN